MLNVNRERVAPCVLVAQNRKQAKDAEHDDEIRRDFGDAKIADLGLELFVEGGNLLLLALGACRISRLGLDLVDWFSEGKGKKGTRPGAIDECARYGAHTFER